MHTSLAAAIGLFCLGITEARAQPTARDSLVLRALSRFEGGDRIRVALLRAPFVGSYVGTRGDTVFFGTPGQPPMAFRFHAVDSVWRVGRATARGPWSGALVGAGFGLLGVALRSEDDARGLTRGGLAVAATTGAGAAFGALLGRSLRSWRLVYADPKPPGL